MRTHTEGPWRAYPYPAEIVIARDVKSVWDRSRYVANITWEDVGEGLNEEDKANAHLIAASPELYLACREALWLLEHGPDAPVGWDQGMTQAWERARQAYQKSEALTLLRRALAKAEGHEAP